MLLNPYETQLTCYAGMRLLVVRPDLPIEGFALRDTVHAQRVWTVEGLYAPVPGRAIGGVRIKLRDQHQFVTFCNQRDFEVLVEDAVPGQHCDWLGKDYVAPTDRNWYGLCCDEEDLRDDLYEIEITTRHQHPQLLVPGYCFTRRVHVGVGADCEEDYYFVGERTLGRFPDTRFETVEQRWIRSERRRLRWRP